MYASLSYSLDSLLLGLLVSGTTTLSSLDLDLIRRVIEILLVLSSSGHIVESYTRCSGSLLYVRQRRALYDAIALTSSPADR